MIKNDNDLRKELKKTLKEPGGISMSFKIDFPDDEYDEMTETERIELIMNTIRPDTTGMSRSEKECIHMIPDDIIEKGYLGAIKIDKFIAEETYSDRLVVRVYLNDEIFKNNKD